MKTADERELDKMAFAVNSVETTAAGSRSVPVFLREVAHVLCSRATDIEQAPLNAWCDRADALEVSKALARYLYRSHGMVIAPETGEEFANCIRMLQAVPAARERFARMADAPWPWPEIHAQWGNLTKLCSGNEFDKITEWIGRVKARRARG